jgi:hypothetical protein
VTRIGRAIARATSRVCQTSQVELIPLDRRIVVRPKEPIAAMQHPMSTICSLAEPCRFDPWTMLKRVWEGVLHGSDGAFAAQG